MVLLGINRKCWISRKTLSFFRSCTNSQRIQIRESKLPVARRKIAGILCVFQDLSTRPAAILAAKLGAEAIGTASYIPPYTPEMNPIEQIWKEIRKLGFKNEVFPSLDKVVDRLCLTICSRLPQLISHITARAWILYVFVSD